MNTTTIDAEVLPPGKTLVAGEDVAALLDELGLKVTFEAIRSNLLDLMRPVLQKQDEYSGLYFIMVYLNWDHVLGAVERVGYFQMDSQLAESVRDLQTSYMRSGSLKRWVMRKALHGGFMFAAEKVTPLVAGTLLRAGENFKVEHFKNACRPRQWHKPIDIALLERALKPMVDEARAAQ